MSQHDYVLSNQAGAAFRSDLNDALLAIASLNSGATAPATTYAFMLWADTANDLLKQRNAANSAWITKGTLSAVYGGLLSLSGGTLVGTLINNNQPSFLATLATPMPNATGDSTPVTGVADTEIYDQTGAFNLGSNVFTAAVTGRYWFSISASMQQLAVGHTIGQLSLVTSNRNYTLAQGNWGAMRDGNNEFTVSGSFVGVDMDAADTAGLSLFVTGAAKAVDISAGWFAGGLLF